MKKIINILLFSYSFLPAILCQDAATTKLFYSALENADYNKIDKYLESVIGINQSFFVTKSTPRGHKGKYKGPDSRTPLIKAIELKNPELVKYLIEKGADASKEIPYEEFDYCKTCGYGEWKRLKKKHKPISWAIKWGNIYVIDLLIENGANFEQEVENIKSKADLLSIRYFEEKRNFRIEYTPSDLEKLYEHRYTQPKKSFVTYLIQKGLIPTPATINRFAKRKQFELVKLALEAGADVNAYEKNGKYKMCVLCQAVLNCDLKTTKLLLDKYNANTNALCSFYAGGATVMSTVTPKQIATDKYIGKCRGRNDEMTELLIFAEAK